MSGGIRAVALAGLADALLCVLSESAAQAPPDLSGAWALNRSLSDDAAAKVKEVAGPDVMTSTTTLGGRFWPGRQGGALSLSPRTSYGRDEDRINLRQFLLETVAGFAQLEIEQTAEEVKTIHREDGVRIFNLERESSGAGPQGTRLVRRARWQGEQLTLESESGKTKLVEVLKLERGQLRCALRYEAKALTKPLELRLVYDRATSP